MRYRNVKINKNINKYVYRNKRRNSKMSCQLSELCNSFYSANCDCNRSNGKTRSRVGQLRTTTCITVHYFYYHCTLRQSEVKTILRHVMVSCQSSHSMTSYPQQIAVPFAVCIFGGFGEMPWRPSPPKIQGCRIDQQIQRWLKDQLQDSIANKGMA